MPGKETKRDKRNDKRGWREAGAAVNAGGSTLTIETKRHAKRCGEAAIEICAGCDGATQSSQTEPERPACCTSSLISLDADAHSAMISLDECRRQALLWPAPAALAVVLEASDAPPPPPSAGPQPLVDGLVKLEAVCTLEAFFDRSAFYDAFSVQNIAPLKEAIAKINPDAAARIKTNLHMTVKYPGRGKVPGLSEEDNDLYSSGVSVLLHITEIFVSVAVGSAVVSGIDAPTPFTEPSKSNGRPAHLTLWGNPPVMAGSVLIGKPLFLRDPFIQVTEERQMAALKVHCKKAQDLSKMVAKLTSDLAKLTFEMGIVERRNQEVEKTVGIIDGTISPRFVLPIQAAVRRFLTLRHVARVKSAIAIQALTRRNAARRHIGRLRKLGLTNSQHQSLAEAVRHWRYQAQVLAYAAYLRQVRAHNREPDLIMGE